MKVVKLASFTAVGAAAGFVTSGLGAMVLHRRATGYDDILDDAQVGALGGAAVNAFAGAIAAFSPRVSMRQELAELATSPILVGALGGIVGTLLVAWAGEDTHATMRHEFAAGALGTVIATALGCGASVVFCSCRLALCCCPGAEHRVAELQSALLGRAVVTVDDLAEP